MHTCHFIGLNNLCFLSVYDKGSKNRDGLMLFPTFTFSFLFPKFLLPDSAYIYKERNEKDI